MQTDVFDAGVSFSLVTILNMHTSPQADLTLTGGAGGCDSLSL